MTIWSHFMISMKLENWWVLIYLNTSRQIQIDSSFEFDCRIRRLSCHEFALFKLLGCLTLDNLTKSRQKNSLELTEPQCNQYYFWILINLLGSKRTIILIREFSIRVELRSFCTDITQIRFWYQRVIFDNELHTGFELYCCLSILKTILKTNKNDLYYLCKSPFNIWSYHVSLVKNTLTRFTLILTRQSICIEQIIIRNIW